MPQLNPNPWFSIAMFIWIVYLLIMLPKVLSHSYPNNLPSYGVSAHHSTPWFWPWP